MTRGTKIVATLGPATSDPEVLERLIRAGVDVVRLNFSHGKAQDHIDRANLVRTISEKVGRTVALMADLQGPKIRVGKFVDGKVQLVKGERFVLDAGRTEPGDIHGVGLDYKELPRDVKPGDTLLLNDGLIVLTVEEVKGDKVHTIVKVEGELSNNKGINKQGGGLTAPALTAKDMDDIRTAASFRCDYLAVSFPKNSTDMEMARQLANVAGEAQRHKPAMIAKIERTEAIPNLESILRASDGIMVARGDLAVEVGNASVPALQKRMIKMAREMDKVVITATQMMESMILAPVPTRAEVSDVANAVIDGTDAVMLSAETASGSYPVQAVEMMARIICEAEASITEFSRPASEAKLKVAETVAELVCHASRELHLKWITVFTHSGFTARLISRYRPLVPIAAFAPEPETRRRMALVWGVNPLKIPNLRKVEQLAEISEKRLLEEKLVRKGDVIAIVAGTPMGVRGTTNFVKFHSIGGTA